MNMYTNSWTVDSSHHPFLNSSRAVLREILKNEGPSRIAALYRGLSPNLVGNSAGWALYFLWYGQAQDLVRNYRHYEGSQPLSSLEYLCASAGAGGLSAVLTNPIWVVKTRMLSTSATQSGAYPGLLQGLHSLYRTEGIRGLFHGLVPSLAGVSHGALYFVAYEKLKLWRRESKKKQVQSNMDTLVISSLSKVFAGSITYPHQVIRARMQAHKSTSASYTPNPGVIGLIKDVWRNEGAVGFYKGLFPNLLRVVPSTCVTFLVYENVKWRLPLIFNDKDDAIPGEVEKEGTL